MTPRYTTETVIDNIAHQTLVSRVHAKELSDVSSAAGNLSLWSVDDEHAQLYFLDFRVSSIFLSLFSIVVSLSSISLSTLPSSSCGPMYCPGLSGEGTGSMGLGRKGSGRLGLSKAGLAEWVLSSFFSILIVSSYFYE